MKLSWRNLLEHHTKYIWYAFFGDNQLGITILISYAINNYNMNNMILVVFLFAIAAAQYPPFSQYV